MTSYVKWIAPIVVFAVGLGVAGFLIATAPEIDERPPPAVAPLVAVMAAEPRTIQFRVHSQGTVAARTESELVPQVSGTIVNVSASFVSGGFFAAGDLLLEIDAADYEVARERARASVARAESEVVRAQKEVERLRGLIRSGVVSQSQFDDVDRAFNVASAGLKEARAVLSQSERDVERTRIRAPFTGRVRDERVDLGQFVNRGTPIATLYATDRAEVRLPIPDAELAFLDLPPWDQSDMTSAGPSVVLRASFAGSMHEWEARIVRTEGEIDARSRMVHIVAQVDDPYRIEAGRPPLAVGLFVEAEIAGIEARDVIVAPRGALRDKNHLLVVDAEDRLRWRLAEVVRFRGAEVVVAASSVKHGDRIVTTEIETAVDGMHVRPVAQAADAAPAAANEG